MHATATRDKIKTLKKNAKHETKVAKYLKALDLTEAKELAKKLNISSCEKLKLAEKLEYQARLEDLSVYKVEMKKTVRKRKTKIYTYWYASWRLEKKVKNVYIGSTTKMKYDEALEKARMLKAEDLTSIYEITKNP